MKTRAKWLLLGTAVCGMLVAWLPAWADGWTGRQITAQVVYKQDRTVILYGQTGVWKNPDACDDASRLILLPAGSPSPAAYTEQYATLLGAHLSGREVNAFVSGCAVLGGSSVPVVKQVAVY
jgi:hypothetical protein